jgi:hypothetical protein
MARLHAGFGTLNYFSGSSDLMSEYSSKIRYVTGAQWSSRMAAYQDPRRLFGGWMTEPDMYGESQGAQSSSSPSNSTIVSTTPLGTPERTIMAAPIDDWSPRSTETSLSGDASDYSGNYQLQEQPSTLSTLFQPSGIVGYPDNHDTSIPRYGYSHTHGHDFPSEHYGHGPGHHYSPYSASSSPTTTQHAVNTSPLYDAPYTSLVSY